MSIQELIQLEEELLRRAQHLHEKMLLRWPVGTVVRFYFTLAQRRRGTYSQGFVQGPGAQATATLRVRVVRKHTPDATHKGGERELDVHIRDILDAPPFV